MCVVRPHSENLAISAMLTDYAMKGAIPPSRVFAVLNSATVPFVLIGTYALGGWMNKPRASNNIDFVVPTRWRKRAIESVRQAFPHLKMMTVAIEARFETASKPVFSIDIVKLPQPLQRITLRNAIPVHIQKQRYKIPSLQAALVLKYASIADTNRELKDRYQDAHDFICMARSPHLLDTAKLSRLASQLFPENGTRFLAKVESVRRRGKFEFDY